MTKGQIKMSGNLRIMRAWEERNLKTGKLYNYSMILMDRNSEQILCLLKPEHYSTHRDKLREQNVISLKFFSILESEKGYRPLRSNLQMIFNTYTSVRVKNEENENMPTYRFFFTELEQLHERSGDTVYTIGNTVLLCFNSNNYAQFIY
ncbi:hypothetical protein MKX03_003349 [Papaver bracteatum]|nr:hypothetical protein MKX03_003349 [Papaver bracteatum]